MNVYVKRIRDLREDNDLTQTEIADLLGTSQTMYARYERGANEIPVRHIIKLCKFYNVSADYILGITDKKWGCKKTAQKKELQVNRKR
ncbi:MAG: helix-turn-helix domain-containing protein [Acutalibacteraceae bacterium]